MYLLFLDASGDPVLPKPMGKSPSNYYIMAGLAIKPESWMEINTELKKLLMSYFSDKPKIPDEIHYTDLLAKKDAWGFLSDDQQKSFTNDMINLLLSIKPILFATVVKKREHYDKYSVPEPVTQLALRFTATRFSRFLQRINDCGIIVYDSESAKSDLALRGFILKCREKGIVHQGDPFHNPMAVYRTQDNLRTIIESIFFIDSRASPVVQLVDFCANSIYANFQLGKSYRYDKIKVLYDSDGKEIFGLKIWPTE